MRRFSAGFAVGALWLLAPANSFGQSRPPAVQIAPSTPAPQRQFCAAYQDNAALHKTYEAKLAAAENPIAKRLAERDQPDFLNLFRTQQLAAVGEGTFRDWVGRLALDVYEDLAFIVIEFPCAQDAFKDAPKLDKLYIGNSFRGGFGSGTVRMDEGISIYSPAGQALAKLAQGELVMISGTLHCATTLNLSNGGGACDTSNDGWNRVLAHISTLRTAKGGGVIPIAKELQTPKVLHVIPTPKTPGAQSEVLLRKVIDDLKNARTLSEPGYSETFSKLALFPVPRYRALLLDLGEVRSISFEHAKPSFINTENDDIFLVTLERGSVEYEITINGPKVVSLRQTITNTDPAVAARESLRESFAAEICRNVKILFYPLREDVAECEDAVRASIEFEHTIVKAMTRAGNGRDGRPYYDNGKRNDSQDAILALQKYLNEHHSAGDSGRDLSLTGVMDTWTRARLRVATHSSRINNGSEFTHNEIRQIQRFFDSI